MRRSTIFEFLNNHDTVTGHKIRLRPRRVEDAADEYRWRTDEELCLLDAAIRLELTYPDFLDRYMAEIEYPGLTFTLAVETMDGRHIGNCSMFNFDFLTGTAEVGLMIGEKDCWGKGYGSDIMKTFLNYIFRVSTLHTILLRTLGWNKRAHACFKKCGFTPCGTTSRDNYRFTVMEIKRPENGPDNQ